MMHISGITICVDYSDLLEVSIDRWNGGLDEFLVVTSTMDTKTRALCYRRRIPCWSTDIFYANGAKFNKGAALTEAIVKNEFRKGAEWLLAFDADMVPSVDWRSIVEKSKPQKGLLYGAHRYVVNENATLRECDLRQGGRDVWHDHPVGYFFLFHNQDLRIPDPIFETHWIHAGNYDHNFSKLWNGVHGCLDELGLVHLGELRRNWLGRGMGREEELHSLLASRKNFEDTRLERIVMAKENT